MINLLVTVFGGLLLIGGFYGMSLGFSAPPNLLLFFLGLCSSVLGLIIVGLFGSKIDFSRQEIMAPKKMGKESVKTPKSAPKEAVKKEKLKKISKTIKTKPDTVEEKEKPVKPKPKVKKAEPIPTIGNPVRSVPKVKQAETVPNVAEEKETPVLNTVQKGKQIRPLPKIKPVKSKKVSKDLKEEEKGKKSAPVETEHGKPMRKITPKPSFQASNKKPEKVALKKIPSTKISDVPEEITDNKSVVTASKIGAVPKTMVKKDLKSENEEDPKPRPKHVDLKTLKSRNEDEMDNQFVKNRLERLKKNYVENAKEIENIIDERLDSFKGTLDKLKVESQEPNIIWSFDAGDVKDTLNDTISKATNTVLMMYPWVRNIDVGMLKKFMDTDSRMIIQEASLDDDTSVELIKLLLDNNVKIRTMPNVHTVAVVSDDTNGLIISTDPIYESFEVGVVYKDHKSVEEIRRLFEDAWNISKDINLEIKQ